MYGHLSRSYDHQENHYRFTRQSSGTSIIKSRVSHHRLAFLFNLLARLLERFQ